MRDRIAEREWTRITDPPHATADYDTDHPEHWITTPQETHEEEESK